VGAAVSTHHVPNVAIELVSMEKRQPLKPPGLQMCGKLIAVNIFKLGQVPSVISGFAEVCFTSQKVLEPSVVGQDTSMLLSSSRAGTARDTRAHVKLP